VRGFRLTLAYDGTAFHGWQVQPELRTVQGVLEQALTALPIERPSRIAGAGRTDAGVHARGQVASFQCETGLPSRALPPLLNRGLPDDVRIEDAAEVDLRFHARHSAVGRRYAYRLLWHDDVLWDRFAWAPDRSADPDALSRALRPLEGEHDFAAFQAAGAADTRSTCRVSRASIGLWDQGLRFDLVADHFLYHMVRNIVGTALHAARSSNPEDRMRSVLESRDRRSGGVTAPARGLSLEQVFYDGGRS
jgi:tRNA pseudouridine38-40 synthase